MYRLYSVLIARARRRRCRRTSSTRPSATRSTSAACASGSATCRSSFNLDGDESIWIHAVSVGEVLTARPLVADLQARAIRACACSCRRRRSPGSRWRAAACTDVDAVFYFPFDWTFIVRRTLRLVQPRLFIMMETEIWPNLLRECRRARRQDGAGQRPHLVAVVSALPAGPAVLPPRARRRRSLLHAERGVGAAAHRPRRRPGARHRHRQPEVRLAASCRRRPRTASRATACCASSACRRTAPVLVAGSTLRGEEAAVLARLRARSRRASPSALLILAPRHPERFAEVERLARDAGFVTVRRIRAADRRRAARRRRRARHASASWRSSIRSRTAVFVGGSLVRPRRPQHPRAGGLRQADRVRSAHAELQGDRRRVPRATTPRSRCRPSASSNDGAAGAGHRSGAPRPPRRRGARAGRGQPRRQEQDAGGDRRAAAARRRPRPRPTVVRPFRLVH